MKVFNERFKLLYLCNLGLFCVSVFFSVACVELVLRLYYFGNVFQEAVSSENEFWRHDPELGWSHIPNARGYFSNYRNGFNGFVSFDDLGIRHNGPNKKFISDSKKILVLGDSTTAGFEVNNEETYSALLEEKLQGEERLYQVYNAGVRGYGTDQSYLNLRKLSRSIQFDYVLYMFTDNDFINNSTIKRGNRVFGKPAFVFDQGNLSLVNFPAVEYDKFHYSYIRYFESGYEILNGEMSEGENFERVKDFIRSKLALYYPLQKIYETVSLKYNVGIVGERQKVEESIRTAKKDGDVAILEKRNEKEQERIPVNRDLEIIESILLKMKEVNENLIVTSFTTGKISENADFLMRICEKRGITYFDLSKYFKENTSLYVWRDDAHWNQRGHKTAAYALYEELPPILRTTVH